MHMRPQSKQLYEAQIIINRYRTDFDNHLIFDGNPPDQATQQIDGKKSLIMRRVFSAIANQIQALTLYSLPVSYKIVDVLAEIRFQKLKRLDLQDCKIEETGVKKLVNKQWPALDWLTLDKNNLGDAEFQIFINGQVLNQVQRLGLTQTGITWKGLRTLPSANLSNLTELFLDQNKIGKRGVQFLRKSKLPQLQYLALFNTQITNESIRSLIKAEWPQLKDLQISLNDGITSDCLAYLQGASWKLEKLYTSLTRKLCISYFSSVVRRSGGQKKFKVRIKLQLGEIVEGNDTFINIDMLLNINTFMNAQVLLTRVMTYDV